MTTLNALAGAAVDVLLAPFQQLPPLAGLAAAALVATVTMLFVFKVTSRQDRVAELKRQTHAAIYEIRLFADDLLAIFRAQREILWHCLAYLRLSLVPMLWMTAPLVFLLAHLHGYYGYVGPAPGEPVLVKVTLRGGADAASSDAVPGAKPRVGLRVSDGVRIETPTLWIPSQREVSWRISAERSGQHELAIHLGGDRATKSLHVSDHVVRRSRARVTRGVLNQLLHPAEPPLPDGGPFETIEIGYAGRRIDVLGWKLPWLGAFIPLTMIFAFALRKPFGVIL